MKNYDVAVIGGGFAGVAAALAAARAGASVILIEKGNALGGAAVNCLVNPFMSWKTKIDGTPFELSTGIFSEILTKMRERNAMRHHSFLEEELKVVLNGMIEGAGVDLLFHAYLCAVNTDGDTVNTVSLATVGGVIDVKASYFVDATGDAQAAFLAGCPTVLGRESDHLCQPMTLCFRLGNVDIPRFNACSQNLKLAHKAALEAGELINPRENILVFQTPIPNVLHFNTTRVVKLDPTSPEDVTKAELTAHKQVQEIYEFMKQHTEGLENSFLMMTAAEIGVRESRMIVGDYVLTEDNCRAFTVFEDAIAACNYAIDIHNPEGTGTSLYYFPEGKFYTIPYRSLIPQNTVNMLVAGRCISSDHGAQASYRIMPTVCSIGEAAGTAIGLAVRHKQTVREIDVGKLQSTLKANRAFIGF